MTNKKALALFAVILLCVALSGCAPKFNLVYQQKDFKPDDIDVITVLPILDARRQVYSNYTFEDETGKMQGLIVEKLEKKGYTPKPLDDTSALGNIHPTQIPFLDAVRVKKIGPSNANWILVPTVCELKTYAGATTKIAEIVCYLFEKRTGKLVWEGSGRSTDLRPATKGLMNTFPSKN